MQVPEFLVGARVGERLELDEFLAGLLGQLERFTEQQAARDAGDEEAQMLDRDFVEMLEYGMPPACGWENSERVFWILEGRAR